MKKITSRIVYAAIFLACAGLNRLGLAEHIREPVSTDIMLPAVAQGAIALELRADDADTAQLVAPLNDAATALCVAAERAFLAKLDGSCRTPIAGLAELSGNVIRFRAAETALRLGEEAAAELLDRAGSDFLRVLA